MYPTLWLIRHASSVLSGTGRWQGWLNVGLSDEGRQQAICRRYAEDLPVVNLAFTSPLRRCVETCEIFFPHISLKRDGRLRTRNLGEWEGLTTEQISQQGGHWFSPFAEQAPPNGESLEEVWQRVSSFIRDMSCLCGPQAIITHGAIIGLILARLNIQPVIIPPCSFVIIEYIEGQWVLKQGPTGSVPPV